MVRLPLCHLSPLHSSTQQRSCLAGPYLWCSCSPPALPPPAAEEKEGRSQYIQEHKINLASVKMRRKMLRSEVAAVAGVKGPEPWHPLSHDTVPENVTGAFDRIA